MTGIIHFIKLELSGSQAEFFRFCQDNYNDLMILKEDGFFDLKNGQYIINKDEHGTIRETKINKIGYKYRKTT